MRDIRVNKGLTCGCCGQYFKTWEWYIDQDQDNGYGICVGCQGDIAQDNEDMFLHSMDILYSNMSPENKLKWDKFGMNYKKLLVNKAFDDGILGWKVG